MNEKKFDAKEFMFDALGWIIGDKEITFDKNNEEEAIYRKEQLSWYCEQYARLSMEKNLELCDISCILRKCIKIATSNKNKSDILNSLFSGMIKTEEDEVNPVYIDQYIIHALHGMEDNQKFWIFRLQILTNTILDVSICSTTNNAIEECHNDEILCRVVLPNSEIITQKPGSKFLLSEFKNKLIELNHLDIWEALVHIQTKILLYELMNKKDKGE